MIQQIASGVGFAILDGAGRMLDHGIGPARVRLAKGHTVTTNAAAILAANKAAALASIDRQIAKLQKQKTDISSGKISVAPEAIT